MEYGVGEKSSQKPLFLKSPPLYSWAILTTHTLNLVQGIPPESECLGGWDYHPALYIPGSLPQDQHIAGIQYMCELCNWTSENV